MAQTRTVPTGIDGGYHLAPIDHIARAIADASPGPGTILHLTNPQPISFNTIIDHLRAAGYALIGLPLDAWRISLATSPATPQPPFWTSSSPK